MTGFKVRVTDSAATPKVVEKILAIAVIHAPPVLTLTPMDPGFAGASYSWTFNATQGKSPYVWSTTTALPAGLTLNSATGILSGTLSASQPAGNFTLAISATGSNGVKVTGNFVLQIFAPLSWVSNSSLPGGKVAHDYSVNVSASGGIAPYSFALKTGSTLPAGLALDSSTGLISGVPTTAGNSSFTIIAQDSTNPPNSIERTFSLEIEPYGMSVSGPASVEGTQYLAIPSAQFTVTGGTATYFWSTTPKLPTGLTINSTTGLISGKLMGVPGNFSVSVFVKDGKNQTASAPLTIASTPSGPLEWVTAEALPGGKVASAYSQNLTAKGGKPAYTFALKTGSTLPAGLKLASTGLLSGTPTAPGNFSFTVTVKDTASPVNVIERTFTLAVQAYGMSVSGPETITIKRYQPLAPATFTVDGGTAPHSWKSTPTLPAGLVLNATTGILSGAPTAADGTYPVVISATDSNKQIATLNCTITIEPADPFDWVTAESLPGGKVASAYSQNLTVQGGRPAYTFALKTGSTLPAGLKLASTGLLSGTPTAPG
ncbi:MAG: putative Ig domain-containing protein, partial [Luteolibacter sp.]